MNLTKTLMNILKKTIGSSTTIYKFIFTHLKYTTFENIFRIVLSGQFKKKRSNNRTPIWCILPETLFSVILSELTTTKFILADFKRGIVSVQIAIAKFYKFPLLLPTMIG